MTTKQTTFWVALATYVTFLNPAFARTDLATCSSSSKLGGLVQNFRFKLHKNEKGEVKADVQMVKGSCFKGESCQDLGSADFKFSQVWAGKRCISRFDQTNDKDNNKTEIVIDMQKKNIDKGDPNKIESKVSFFIGKYQVMSSFHERSEKFEISGLDSENPDKASTVYYKRRWICETKSPDFRKLLDKCTLAPKVRPIEPGKGKKASGL